MVAVIDSDQHLFESRTLWSDHIEPAQRDEALRIVDDDLGYAWLTWRDRPLSIAHVQHPGRTTELGDMNRRAREGKPPEYAYDEELPAAYWEPGARRAQIGEMGLDAAVLFPNFGLLWERRLSSSVPALTANMSAWNRWCATVVAEGRGALHPVAHLTLRDPQWLEQELARLGAAGVRLGMVAPAAVDGRPLSHPDHERLWSVFVEHGVTPVFHVADQPHLIDDAFYPDQDEATIPPLESIFLWVPPAVAVTDLITNGVLDRHAELRIAIVELSAIWVPLYLRMLDGGWDFTTALNGNAPAELTMRPSDYFRRQVRVSAFSYERPSKLIAASGDLFMCCSDFPHSEGTATPLDDYGRDETPEQAPGLFHDNVAALLSR